MILSLFTHNDLDGAGAALAISRRYDAVTVDTHFCAYGDHIERELDEYLKGLKAPKRHILAITDITPSAAMMERIHAAAPSFEFVTAYDHHATTIDYSRYPWFHHDVSMCATRLAHPSEETGTLFDEFALAVDAWDRWLLDSPYRTRGEQLNLLFKFLGARGFCYRFGKDSDADLSTWLKEVIPVLEQQRDNAIHGALNSFKREPQIFMSPQGFRYAITVVSGEAANHVSELGNLFLSKIPEIDYVALAIPGADTVSLRSRQGGVVDVGMLAKSMGKGGGHPNAAGFRMAFVPDILSKVKNALFA